MTDTTDTALATMAELMGGRDKLVRFLCDRLDEHQKTVAKLRTDHDDDAQLLDAADKYIQRLEKQLEAARSRKAIAKRDKTIKERDAKITRLTEIVALRVRDVAAADVTIGNLRETIKELENTIYWEKHNTEVARGRRDAAWATIKELEAKID